MGTAGSKLGISHATRYRFWNAGSWKVPAESVVVRRVAFAHVESRYSGDMATTAPGRGVPSLRRRTPDSGADKVSVCAMGSGHAAVQGARRSEERRVGKECR